jgi:hypothetical protein
MASEDYQKLSLEAMSLESTNTFVLFPCMVGPPQELGGNNTGCLAGAQWGNDTGPIMAPERDKN